MKFLLPIILFLTLVGCSQHRKIDDSYPWPASGIAEADSLLLELEHARSTPGLSEETPRIVKEFCDVAEKHKDNKILKLRQVYVNAPLRESRKELLEYLRTNMARLDSADSPYDWYMLRNLLVDFHAEPDAFKHYKMITENIKFFSDKGAEPEVALNYLALAFLMIDLHDEMKARMYVNEAMKLEKKHNRGTQILGLKVLNALLTPEDRQPEVYRRLFSDTEFEKEPRMLAVMLQNAAIVIDSLPLIEKSINLIRTHDVGRNNLAGCILIKGGRLREHGRSSEAIELLRTLGDSIDCGKIEAHGRYRAILHQYLSEAYEEVGMQDSSLMHVKAYIDCRDSMERELKSGNIYELDALERIRDSERNAQKQRMVIIYIGILITLSLVLFIAYIITRNKQRHETRRHEQALLQVEIENEQKVIAAQSVVMEENNKMITDIGVEIKSLAEKGLLADEGLNSLSRMMRVHKSNELNRRSMLKVNQETNSRFMTSLKDDYPELSETMLRFAALMVVGADTRQMAAVLNITPESVRKNRYRLRLRLNVPKEQTLYDFLRRYNTPR